MRTEVMKLQVERCLVMFSMVSTLSRPGYDWHRRWRCRWIWIPLPASCPWPVLNEMSHRVESRKGNHVSSFRHILLSCNNTLSSRSIWQCHMIDRTSHRTWYPWGSFRHAKILLDKTTFCRYIWCSKEIFLLVTNIWCTYRYRYNGNMYMCFTRSCFQFARVT